MAQQQGIVYRDATTLAHLRVSFTDEGARRFVEEEANFSRTKDIITQLGDELKKSLAQRTELEGKLEEATGVVDRCTAMLRILEEECSNNTEVNKKLSDECTEYIAQNDALLGEVTTLRQQRDALDATVSDLQARLGSGQHSTEANDWAVQYQNLVRQKDMDSRAHATSLEHLQDERDEAFQQLAEARQQAEQLQQHNRLLKVKLEGVDFTLEEGTIQQEQREAEHQELLMKLHAYEHRCAQLEAQHSVFVKRDAEREKRCQQCERKIREFERDYSNMLEERNVLQRDNLILMEMYDELHREVREHRAHHPHRVDPSPHTAPHPHPQHRSSDAHSVQPQGNGNGRHTAAREARRARTPSPTSVSRPSGRHVGQPEKQ